MGNSAETSGTAKDTNRTRVWFFLRETIWWRGRWLTAGSVYSCPQDEWENIEKAHPGATLRTGPPMEVEVAEE